MRIKRDDPKIQKPQSKRFIPREGRKVFAQVGYDRDEAPFGKGIEVGLVVIKDLEPDDANPDQPNDVGLLGITKLWLNEKGAHYLLKFSDALKFGADDPAAEYDAESDEPAEDGTPGFVAVLSSNMGILVGEVVWVEKKKAGKVVLRKDGTPFYQAEVRNYQQADLVALGLTIDGELTPDVLAVIEKGEAEYDENLTKRNEWRRNNPRPTGGGSAGRPSAPASRSSGGSSSSAARPAALPPTEHQNQDDDGIPFRARTRHSDAVPHRKRSRSRSAVRTDLV